LRSAQRGGLQEIEKIVGKKVHQERDFNSKEKKAREGGEKNLTKGSRKQSFSTYREIVGKIAPVGKTN